MTQPGLQSESAVCNDEVTLQDLLSLEERQTLVQYVKSLAERAGAVAELLAMRHEAYNDLGVWAQRSRQDLELLLGALEKAPVRLPAGEERRTGIAVPKQ